MQSGKASRLGMIVGLGVALLAQTAASAGDIRVEAESLPMALWRDAASPSGSPLVDGKIEASGVEVLGDGQRVLIAHDKVDELHVVETATGRIVGKPVSFEAFPKGAKYGPKWEGMARDDQGFYYVVGSHSGKSDEERQQHSYLFRFRLKGTGTSGDPLTVEPSSVRRWSIVGSLASALGREPAKVDQLKIEGLTIRTRPAEGNRPARTELIVGLRLPSDLVRTFAADITQTPAPDAELAFERLFAFQGGKREGVQAQLTSLLYLPSWKGFFVVTATEDEDNAFHGNTLWFLPDEQIPERGLATPQRVYDFEVAMKAEGLADLPVLDGAPARSARLLIAFDNDAHTTHIPSRIQTIRLTRGK